MQLKFPRVNNLTNLELVACCSLMLKIVGGLGIGLLVSILDLSNIFSISDGSIFLFTEILGTILFESDRLFAAS